MNPSDTQATVRVPGTTSNLGPGFDTLGLALSLHNDITVTRQDQPDVRITSSIPEDARGGATAMLTEAAGRFFSAVQQSPFGFDISITGDVPLARGLGSSVTARLGCMAALNRMAGMPLSRSSLLDLAAELEGHPDNAAPAIFGGFTVAGMVSGTVRCHHFPVTRELRFVTLIPDFEISTPAARKLVPQQFSKRDTIHCVNRTALITAAFASGDFASLRQCFEDRIHQPYRKTLLPQLDDVIAAAEAAGAIGGWLSGSGSTIIGLTLGDATPVADAMLRVLPGSRALVLSADNDGLNWVSP